MLDHAALGGQATPGIYSQTFSSGDFYFVFSLEGPESEITLELGRNLISKIEEVIFQTPEISPSEIVEMQREQLSSEIKIDILAAKVLGQTLILAGAGMVGAKLWRREKLINLLSNPEKIMAVKGPLQHNDLLVLGTSEFIETLLQNESLMTTDSSPESLRDDLTLKIENSEGNAKMAAIFLKVDLVQADQLPSESEVQESIAASPTEKPIGLPVNPWAVKDKVRNLGKLLNFREKGISLGQGPDGTPSRWRRILYLVVVAFIVLISILTYQLRSKVSEKKQQNLMEIQKRADQGLESSGKLVGLNDQIAREMLMQTKNEVDALIVADFGPDWQKEDSSETKKLKAIEAKLDLQIGKTSHAYGDVKATVFYDFGLLKSNPNVVSVCLHDGQIVALDGGNGAIYSLSSKNKAASLVFGNNDLRQGHYLDFSAETAFLGTDQGIVQKKLDATGPLKLIIKPSDKWGQIKSLVTFGGNLYLLDPGNNQIWKYQGTDLGFGDLTNYVKTGLSVDITRGNAMAVDGFVYVLTSSGRIAKFAGGDISEFEIKGLLNPLTSPTSFYTSEELQNVYIWEPSTNRIVVLDKKGNYQAEYTLAISIQQIAVSNILADESVKKIFLVTKDKVYSVDIR